MHIEATTYTFEAVVSTYSSQKGTEESKRFEPAVLGAADTLPGQGPERSGFQVDRAFGFCAQCGQLHGLGVHQAEAAQKSSGGPDLAGEDEAVVASPGEAVEGEETEGAGEKPVERDSLTGEVELTEEEQTEVQELKKRDQKVRTHEHAHVAAGGQYVRGGIQYEYQTGPDGRRYVVGGEVSIDTSPESDPEDTIRKAQTIRQAALAPAEPSGQDRRAAAAAAQMAMKARQELAEGKLEGDGEGEVSEVDDVLVGAAAEENGLGDGSDESGSDEGGTAHSGIVSQADESPIASVASFDGGLVAGEGFDVGETDDKGLSLAQADGGGLTVGESEDEGLPEVATPSSSPPITKLDYGQGIQTGQLVDMFG